MSQQAFRIAVVALLVWIALEMGGAARLESLWHDTKHAVSSAGLKDEAPAAPLPTEAPTRESTDKVIADVVRANRRPFAASGAER